MYFILKPGTALKNELENRGNAQEKAHKKDLVEYIGKV
jgi:hypothetical protein